MKKSKKGDTLIEILAATAILIIGLTGSGYAIRGASRMWLDNSKKLDSTTYNQCICQDMKAKGMTYIGQKYANISKRQFFVYFNSKDEIMTNINKSTYTYNSDSNPGYSECKSQNGSKSNYGALIKITDDRGMVPTGYEDYAYYKVNVTVWNLKDNQGSYVVDSSFTVGG